MTLFVQVSGGKPKTVASKPATTAKTDLYSSKDKITGMLDSISVCNITAASANFSISVEYGGNEYFIYNALPLAAHTTQIITGHNIAIPKNGHLNVYSLTASAIHFVATIVETTAQQTSG